VVFDVFKKLVELTGETQKTPWRSRSGVAEALRAVMREHQTDASGSVEKAP
jgi:hypothetical protein